MRALCPNLSRSFLHSPWRAGDVTGWDTHCRWLASVRSCSNHQNREEAARKRLSSEARWVMRRRGADGVGAPTLGRRAATDNGPPCFCPIVNSKRQQDCPWESLCSGTRSKLRHA